MDIKFQFLYRGAPYSSTNDGFNWHKKVYSLNDFMNNSLYELSDIHGSCELVAKRQSTSLKDKNGVEIYCGDIVKHEKGYVWTVIFDDDESRFALKCKVPLIRPLFKDRAFNLEVIGNIHQNPELIENNN